MQVLVLESERSVAAILAQEVQQAGHLVLGPVFTVEEALEMASANQADMAVIGLDGLHGGAATEALNNRWDMPCLLVADSLESTEHHQRFAVACLSRPLGPEAVGRALGVVEAIIEGAAIEEVPEEMTLFIEPVDGASGRLPQRRACHSRQRFSH